MEGQTEAACRLSHRGACKCQQVEYQEFGQRNAFSNGTRQQHATSSSGLHEPGCEPRSIHRRECDETIMIPISHERLHLDGLLSYSGITEGDNNVSLPRHNLPRGHYSLSAILRSQRQVGSGPTVSQCRRTVERRRHPCQRWDRRNAEAVAALGCLERNGQWQAYCRTPRPTTT